MNKQKFVLFICFVFGIVLNLCCADKTSSNTYTVRPEHPRIYINADNIGAIRARIADTWSIQHGYYQEIKAYAESIMDKEIKATDRTSPQRLKILAFLYLIGEVPGTLYRQYSIDDFGAKGIAYLRAFAGHYSKRAPGASYGSATVQSMSVAYDWLYHKLSKEDKNYIVPRLIAAAEGQKKNIEWQQTFKDYSVGGNNYCVAGLAFYGDGINDAKAKEYIEHYINKYRKEFIAGWNFAIQNGGSFQGSDGHMQDIAYFLYVIDAFYTATDMDDLGTFDYLKYASEWLTYALVPHWNNGNNLFNTDNDFLFGREIGIEEIRSMGRITSYPHFSDKLKSLTAWLCNSRLPPPQAKRPHWTTFNYDFKLMDLIWRDDTAKAKSPVELQLPLTRHFGVLDNGTGHAGGVGIVIMKSAWQDPNATFAVFKCAPFKYTHDDHDSNSFIIHKKGLLAIDSGMYENGDWWSHEVNYAYRTVAHNSLLVYDPKEIFGGSASVANDGGQRLPQKMYSRNYPKDYAVGGGRDIGGMARFESVEGVYDYMRGDATRAYQSTLFTDGGNRAKLSLFTRDFVYLRSNDGTHDYFVVFDKVVSTEPGFQKRWLLHSINEPSVNGTFTKGGIDGAGAANKFGGTPGSISLDADTVIIREAGGTLFSKTIFPQKHTVVKIGGPDAEGNTNTAGSYESFVNGTNYKTDTQRSKSYTFKPLQGAWRIEVAPLTAQKEDVFLHVLYPCDKTITAMPPTTPVESKNATMAGVHIAALADVPSWVVLFSKNTHDVHEVTYEVKAEGNARQLLCDMKKNTPYEILHNGKLLATKKSSDQGTLFFEGELGGDNVFLVKAAD